MKRAVLIFLIVTISLFSIKGEGQSCSVPGDVPYIDDHIILKVRSIMDQNVYYNSTVFIQDELQISNSTIIMDGKGFILNKTATLSVSNSSIVIGEESIGFYLDLLGDASFHNVVMDGCLDRENGYFGIYVGGRELRASGLEMRRSGMVRMDGGTLEMNGSTINGVVSFSGNVSLTNCTVDQTGITQLGEGDVFLRDVIISTNISFTQTAGFSALEGANIEIDNVEIKGSFNGGLSISQGQAVLDGVEIALDDGVFGIRSSDTHIRTMEDLSISGVLFGIELGNSILDNGINGSVVDTRDIGIALQGNSLIRIYDTEVHRAEHGIVTSSPVVLENVTMSGNMVGLLSEDSSITRIENCRFVDYGQWGIEDETWDRSSYQGNVFEPSETGLGQVAWWGWVDIEVSGPDGISVVGAEVILKQTSGHGSQYGVEGDKIGLVWGFTDGSGSEKEMRYNATARWGNARSNVSDFLPERGKTLSFHLNMTDIWIKNLEFVKGVARVTVACRGSEAKDVEVVILVDGSEYNSRRLEIGTDEERTVEIPLSGIYDGPHSIRAVASTDDEYSLMNGYLQENNAMEIEGLVRPERDDGKLGLLLLGIALGIILLLMFAILMRKQD